MLDLENTIRHSLKAFGIRIKGTGLGGFDAAVREAVADDALTSELMDAMLAPRRCCGRNTAGCTIWWRHAPRDLSALHGESGGGLVTALSFVTAIDGPSRFDPSRDVAAYFGLTSRRWQSGTSIDVQGRISKAGDPDVRRALYEAASALMTRFKGREKVRRRAWRWPGATAIVKVTVAVARELAVIMHAIWTDGTCYVSDAAASARDRAAPAARKDGKLLGAHA